MNVKESFATFTSVVLDMLATDAASIGLDNKALENKVNIWHYALELPT